MGDVILMIVVSLLMMPAARRLLGGVIRAFSGNGSAQVGAPRQGVQMERDPVCGTFVVPSSAVTLVDGSRRLCFCSASCRDRYRAARTA